MCSLIPALVTARAAFPAFAEGDALSFACLGNYAGTKASEHADMRRILTVRMTTVEPIERRETTQPRRAFPHPSPPRVHSEMWLIREATVELTIPRATSRPGQGGLGLVRSKEEHGIKNLGLGPATCFTAIATGAAVR